MKQTEDHLIFGSLVIGKCIFSQTNAVIDREKPRNNPTWDILWEFGFRNTCSRKSRPVWKWSPRQSPVLPCPVRWLPLMAARESSGTPSQQNRKNPLQILLQHILVFGFKCLKVQLPTRLSWFFSYRIWAWQKIIWILVSLDGFYLSIRHLQWRLLEIQGSKIRGVIPIDGMIYLRHEISHEFDFPTNFCLDYTWGWGNLSMMEMAPVWLQGDVTQQTPSLCSASEENHGWNEDTM